MPKINKTPDFNRMAYEIRQNLVRYAAVTGVNFFKDSFYNQGFTDKALIPWENGLFAGTDGYRILIRTRNLQGSIQVFNKSLQRIVFGSDERYAQYHNEGATIAVTERSRKFFWYMYRQTGDQRWKAMALTEKTSFRLPKRQFIGESHALLKKLDTWLLNSIKKQIKQ